MLLGRGIEKEYSNGISKQKVCGVALKHVNKEMHGTGTTVLNGLL